MGTVAMSQRVQHVISAQGNDLSDLINRYAEIEQCPAVGLLAGLISESGLNEHAERHGQGDDQSVGLGQQTLRWASVGDHTNSAANWETCRAYYYQPENAIAEAARQYGAYYRQYGSFEEAWSRYNGGPGMAFAHNPNAANLRRGWNAAQLYLSPDEEPTTMTDYAGAGWAPSPNVTFGRQGSPITAIVLHGTAGNGAVGWFAQPVSQVSAHYVVERDGTVTQCVREQDTAWHAGVVTPDSEFAGGTNPNRWSIGIEHTRDRTNTSPLTPAQLDASLALVTDILARHGPLAMLTHDEIDVGRICPGPGFPLAAFTALLDGENGGDGMRDSQIAIVNEEIIENLNLAIGGLDAVLATDALRDDLRTSLDTARENLTAGALPAAQTLSRDEG
jgi:N-acetylmuramoyl-L-alanine amidase